MKSLCVFCGSNSGLKPVYLQAARNLAEEMLKRNITLVYGGANVGLMGEIANTMLAGCGKVIGVIPKRLVEREVAHLSLTKLHVVETMHERKQLMADLSSGFIAMPGGFGTLDEICEMITWSQLGIHTKPCGFLNVDRFYDDFFKFIGHGLEQGFVKKETFAKLVCSELVGELLEKMGS